MTRVVTFVRFKQSKSFPGKSGPGDIGFSLPSEKKSIRDLKMVATEIGVIARMNGQDYLIPSEDISFCVLAPEGSETKEVDNAAPAAAPARIVINTKG